MSSFLSAAENVARQCENVRRDLKKNGMEKESGAVKVALENHNMVYFWFVLYKRLTLYDYQKKKVHGYFDTKYGY